MRCFVQYCRQPPVATGAAGCKHEHMETGPVCEWHTWAMGQAHMVCGPCFYDLKRHTPITMRVTPFAEATS